MTDEKPTARPGDKPDSNAAAASSPAPVITPAVLHGGGGVTRPGNESTLAGRSVRSVLALSLIWTLCLIDLIRTVSAVYRAEPIDPALVRDLALVAMSYFFSNNRNSSPSKP